MMEEKTYYDGTKLLSLRDLDGTRPEIFICTSNRSAGKTTYFSRLLVRRFKKEGKKFILLFRFNYEVRDAAAKFFDEIGRLFFQGDVMEAVNHNNGEYCELFLNGESCGWALALNQAEKMKRYSHVFATADSMFLDEFQSETGHYCPDEVKKFISLHTSCARGGGKQVRYLPVFLVGNPVSILNPYYCALGIPKRLDDKTRFLRGNGWVMEQGYNDSASKAQKQSAFNRAFADNEYTAYAASGIYLNDSATFIEHPKGSSYYIATLSYMGKEYGVRNYPNSGIVHVSHKVDSNCYKKVALTVNDHDQSKRLVSRFSFLILELKDYFECGAFRFEDLECKQMLFDLLSCNNPMGIYK